MKTSIKLIFICFLSLTLLGFLHSIITSTIGITADRVYFRTFDKSPVQTLFSQYWGFFTKNPRIQKIQLFKIVGNEVQLVDLKNFQLTNLFGLSKHNRIVGHVLEQYFHKIREENKVQCFFKEKPDTDCLQAISEKCIVHNKIKNNMFGYCGKYIIVYSEPIPWLWFSQSAIHEAITNGKIAVIEFE